MTKSKRDILITTALTYANGQIHLGHMLEAIQADIWKRFQKGAGNNCYLISGSDAHGTAIMLAAEKQSMTPEDWIEKVRNDHADDYKQFHIGFDNFDTTHTQQNEQLTALFYNQLNARGDIQTKTIKQFFDPEKQMFLADRFIRGECPKCGATDQYGDNCEACGATYNPTELKNPRSSITGATPIEKESQHYFFDLNRYKDFLTHWIQSGSLQPAIANKLMEWFEQGLQPWNISRDQPYFGFKIPGTRDKYFYVWLDAPIGYIASFQNFCEHNTQIDFRTFWQQDSEKELYHFIGKDIINFHALFWTAMLHGTNHRTPTKIFAHGFVTVNGEKMSKSRGTFITAKKYIEALPAEYLRYYYAAKLNNQVEDIDLNLEDFAARINSDLVGKYVNLASRCAGFITKKFDGMLADTLQDQTLFDEFTAEAKSIAMDYEALNTNKAIRTIMTLADRANQYIDQHKPWSLAKEEGKEKEVQRICTQGLNLFRLLTIYLSPILPVTAEKVATFLNTDAFSWCDLEVPLLNHKIQKFKPLMQRVTPEDLEKLT